MKLSDAIMLNGMTKPQGQGWNTVGSLDAPCAIGGALQAIGRQHINDNSGTNYMEFQRQWEWAALTNVSCPVCDEDDSVMGVIIRLNDKHRWTRQQIAEWVKRIEPAELSANVTCEATVVQNCEDQTGELCGKTCVEGSYLCVKHEAEVGNGR